MMKVHVHVTYGHTLCMCTKFMCVCLVPSSCHVQCMCTEDFIQKFERWGGGGWGQEYHACNDIIHAYFSFTANDDDV